jgi:hypothetical protein
MSSSIFLFQAQRHHIFLCSTIWRVVSWICKHWKEKCCAYYLHIMRVPQLCDPKGSNACECRIEASFCILGHSQTQTVLHSEWWIFLLCWRLPEGKHALPDPWRERRELAYTSLFLLIWGEAANLRFMPECLCFIYHNVMAFCFS